MATPQNHIIMVPFMAQGHIIPFLALAKLILQRNPSYIITIVHTPLNVHNLPTDNPNIRPHALPFRGTEHDLPPDTENTDSLPRSRITDFMIATESLEPHFDGLVADRPPACIIGDVFCGWTVRVAQRHRVPHAVFTTCGGYGTAAYMSLWLHLPHARTHSEEFALPGFPETYTIRRSQMSSYLRACDGSEPVCGFFRRHIALACESSAMLCNTVEEVEPFGVELLAKFTGAKVWTVGPLLPLEKRSWYRRNGRSSGIELSACVEWLDRQPEGSVVYVSFGSQNSIGRPQMMELAKGLEASGKPFIWVVRPPVGCNPDSNFTDEWLPQGFEARMTSGKRGLLVWKWAPQLEILSHRSTGVFLSHCGWNSVLESLSRGVPVIGWPLAAEQFYNIKMLEEELGVGVELATGEESKVGSGDVEKAIRVMSSDNEKGRLTKERAVAVAKTIVDAMRDGDERGSSIKAIDDFLETVLTRRTSSSF